MKYFDSDTVSVISNISRRPADFKVPSIDAAEASEQIEAFNKTNEIKLLLHDVRQDKPHFEPIIQPAHLGKVICVKPMLDNPRIIRQDGAFLLFGIDGDKTKPAQLEQSSVVERIMINKTKKKEISSQLESLGISKATMFPEIEQVASHIKEQYQVPVLQLNMLGNLESRTLDFLSHGGAKSIQELAMQFDVSKKTASFLVGKLNNLGLIERFGSGRNVRWQAKDVIKK